MRRKYIIAIGVSMIALFFSGFITGVIYDKEEPTVVSVGLPLQVEVIKEVIPEGYRVMTLEEQSAIGFVAWLQTHRPIRFRLWEIQYHRGGGI